MSKSPLAEGALFFVHRIVRVMSVLCSYSECVIDHSTLHHNVPQRIAIAPVRDIRTPLERNQSKDVPGFCSGDLRQRLAGRLFSLSRARQVAALVPAVFALASWCALPSSAATHAAHSAVTTASVEQGERAQQSEVKTGGGSAQQIPPATTVSAEQVTPPPTTPPPATPPQPPTNPPSGPPATQPPPAGVGSGGGGVLGITSGVPGQGAFDVSGLAVINIPVADTGTPSTGLGGLGALRFASTGGGLMLSGMVLLTGIRRNPHAMLDGV